MAKELYIVVERYKDAEVVYERLWNRGRIAPEGLEFVQSWFDENVERGYRLVQSNGRQPLDNWMANWSELIDFEVYAVITPEMAGEKLAARIQKSRAAARRMAHS